MPCEKADPKTGQPTTIYFESCREQIQVYQTKHHKAASEWIHFLRSCTNYFFSAAVDDHDDDV